MTFKETFPEIYSLTSNHDVLWTNECNFSSEGSIATMDVLLSFYCANLDQAGDPDSVNKKLHAILDSLIRVQQTLESITEIERVRFLKITIGAFGTSYYNRIGQFHYNYDIFFKSIYDRTYAFGEQLDFVPFLPWSLFESESKHIQSNIPDVTVNWLGQLYYYSRSFSGLNDWGLIHFHESLTLLKSIVLLDYNSAFLQSQLYSWGLYNGFDIECSEMLRLLQEHNRILTWDSHEQTKKIVMSQLAVSKEVAKDIRKEYIDELFEKADIFPIHRLQIYAIYITETKELYDFERELIAALMEFNKRIGRVVNKLELTYSRARYFSVLGDLILLCCKHGEGQFLKKLLSIYFNVDVNTEPVLFVLPNSDEGLIYCVDANVILKSQDTKSKVTELIDITNRLFNIVLLYKGQKDGFYHPQRDTGMPNHKYSKEFEKVVTDFYDFRLITPGPHDQNLAMCHFGFSNLPLQALMIKVIGFTYPLLMSLEKKNPFNEIKNLLLWKGNSMTSEIETECLIHILGAEAINVTTVGPEEASKARFRKDYQSDKYDVIWVSSHGEHGHYSPNDSSIHLSESDSISLVELSELTYDCDKRRLVFLNVCEGAITTQIGEFKNAGFADALSSKSQDVVSHLWMTRPLTAAIFGIIFSIQLGRNKKDPFKAYCLTVKSMLAGKDHVLSRLNKDAPYYKDIAGRIENDSSINWEDILTWGSGAYYI